MNQQKEASNGAQAPLNEPPVKVPELTDHPPNPHLVTPDKKDQYKYKNKNKKNKYQKNKKQYNYKNQKDKKAVQPLLTPKI